MLRNFEGYMVYQNIPFRGPLAYLASDFSNAGDANVGNGHHPSLFHDINVPAWDMETLKAGIRSAKAGTGEVKAVIQKCTFRPREQAFTTLINMCGRQRDWKKAIEVFDSMKALKTVRPNTYTYSALISACSCAGEWQRALSVFDAMKVAADSDPGCRPNHVTYCALVTACERCGQHDMALKLFDEMLASKISPDRVTWIAALSAADKLEKWDKVEALLGEMHSMGIAGTLAVYCGLLHYFAEQARWNEALDHFLVMQELGLAVDEHACIAFMSALSAGGQWKLCLQLLDSMYESYLIIDLWTYNLALAALAKNRRWEEALDVLSRIEMMGLKPNVDSITYVLQACRDAGQENRATEIEQDYNFVFSKASLNETSSSVDSLTEVIGQASLDSIQSDVFSDERN